MPREIAIAAQFGSLLAGLVTAYWCVCAARKFQLSKEAAEDPAAVHAHLLQQSRNLAEAARIAAIAALFHAVAVLTARAGAYWS